MCSNTFKNGLKIDKIELFKVDFYLFNFALISYALNFLRLLL